MNELPDDLRSLEAKLGELAPASEIDTDKLAYQAGYTAAVADGRHRPGSLRTMTTAFGSAAIGVAATLLGMIVFSTDNGPSAPSVSIAEDVQTNAPSEQLPSGDPSRPAQDWRPRPIAVASVEVFAEPPAYNAARWRSQLLQSGGDRIGSLEISPTRHPVHSGDRRSDPPLPTNLQWQRELLQDVSANARVNS